jgi:aryl-alcohol dehydrogenase-like predicted oxidoreductase
MRSLDDMVRAGKILYVGFSDAPAWVVSRANTLADLRGWTPFTALQIQYSLIERTPERDLLPMAEALDLAVTPWAVLGGGALTGKYRKGRDRPTGTRFSQGTWGDVFLTDRNLDIAEELVAFAGQVDRSPSQVALAWLRQRPSGVMVPILGARTLSQIQDNLACLDLTLDAAQVKRLDGASSVPLGFPHDFLATGKAFVYGETFDRIDNHRSGR